MRDDTISLHKEIARLEAVIEWLAQAAANNSWHGARVSPAFMRQQAENAVGASEFVVNEGFFQAFRTENEVDNVQKWAAMVEISGSRYDYKTYEEGVLDTLEWLKGETDLAPDED